MLESMVDHPRPTRAEATDVANAVLDGADGLMLSGESAVGGYPVEAVATMARIIEETEDYRQRVLPGLSDLRRAGTASDLAHGALGRLTGDEALNIPDMVAAAAVYSAHELGAACLVAFSQSGSTARMIARYRPSVPILVFTNSDRVARRLALVWGTFPERLHDELRHHDEVIGTLDRELVSRGLAEAGDRIVLVMGDPIRERPRPNLMRIHTIRKPEGA